MITSLNQRWRDQRGSYRPAGEPIATRLYEVAELADDTTPKAFVEQHHYSGTYPAARARVGLYLRGGLVGVAVFSHPVNDKMLTGLPGASDGAVVDLGRLVLRDEVPGNGESWFLARAFELLHRAGFESVVSLSDPMRRADAAGALVFGGHVGTIYQATNAVYRGRATPRTLHLLPDGRVLNARAMQKVRKLERGWRYVVDQLIAADAAPFSGDPRAWLREQLARVTRTVRHPGNHKYLFGLSRAARRALPESLPYPKLCMEACAA